MVATVTRTGAAATFLFARGSNKAAFTQLTGCAVTRSGTTATLTKTTHGLSNGDIVRIRGFHLEEFNGVFTVANSGANTFDYTIKQDPGANPSGTTGTIDKAVVSASVNNLTGFGADVYTLVMNGGTGPTLPPWFSVGVADADTEGEYLWRDRPSASIVASAETTDEFSIPEGARYWKLAFFGNSAQAVDYWAKAYTKPSYTST